MRARGLGLYQPFQFHEHDNENILTLTAGNDVDDILTLAEEDGVTNPVVFGRTGLRTPRKEGSLILPDCQLSHGPVEAFGRLSCGSVGLPSLVSGRASP